MESKVKPPVAHTHTKEYPSGFSTSHYENTDTNEKHRKTMQQRHRNYPTRLERIVRIWQNDKMNVQNTNTNKQSTAMTPRRSRTTRHNLPRTTKKVRKKIGTTWTMPDNQIELLQLKFPP